MAFKLFQEAKKDFMEKRFRDAADKLGRAYELFPQPMILFRHAEALENLRKVEHALRLYTQLKNAKDASIRNPVRSAIRRLEGLLAQPVELSVLSGDVVGALIYIDGKPYGTTPALLKLSRGTHEIKVTKEGYEPFVVRGFVSEGIDTLKLEARLKPFMGLVRVSVPTGNFTDTRILIDGRLVPIAEKMATETKGINVPVGRHQLECTRTNATSHYRPFVVKAGSIVNLECVFGAAAETSGDVNWAGWITLSTGVVMLGVGGGLLGSYFADVQLAEDLNKELNSSKHIVGGVLLGVGLIATVTGAVLLATGGDDEASEGPPTDEVRLSPLLSPTQAGFVLNGHF